MTTGNEGKDKANGSSGLVARLRSLWLLALMSVIPPAVAAVAPVCEFATARATLVNASPPEVEAACRALGKAWVFFAKRGFFPVGSVTVTFVPDVRLPVFSSVDSASVGKGHRVVGLYDRKERTLTMTSFASPWLRHRPYFGQPFSPAMLESVLVHEMTHALSSTLYEFEPKTHAQDEYLAYASQLESLPSDLRKRVMRGTDWEFADRARINDLVHAAKPHAFGVAAWKHFVTADGGESFMRDIYTGRWRAIDLNDLP